jgi:hypothetical protein
MSGFLITFCELLGSRAALLNGVDPGPQLDEVDGDLPFRGDQPDPLDVILSQNTVILLFLTENKETIKKYTF